MDRRQCLVVLARRPTGIAAHVARRRKGIFALESVSPKTNAANAGINTTRIGWPDCMAPLWQKRLGPDRSDRPLGKGSSPVGCVATLAGVAGSLKRS